MVEYLDPRDGYKLVTLPDWQSPQPWWIEVPEGAEIYVTQFCGLQPAFVRKNKINIDWWVDGVWSEHVSSRPIESVLESRQIIWQRPTMPEELPFIDDEPPAHFVVRPKPRERVYAVIGDTNKRDKVISRAMAAYLALTGKHYSHTNPERKVEVFKKCYDMSLIEVMQNVT